jgi:hypothetical protein
VNTESCNSFSRSFEAPQKIRPGSDLKKGRVSNQFTCRRTKQLLKLPCVRNSWQQNLQHIGDRCRTFPQKKIQCRKIRSQRRQPIARLMPWNHRKPEFSACPQSPGINL